MAIHDSALLRDVCKDIRWHVVCFCDILHLGITFGTGPFDILCSVRAFLFFIVLLINPALRSRLEKLHVHVFEIDVSLCIA